MKDKYAFPLLAFLSSENASLCRLECNVLINDRFTMEIRKSKTPQSAIEYFQAYIKYILINKKPLMSLFSLLWIMGRIGRENILDEVYQTIANLVVEKIKTLNCIPTNTGISDVKTHFWKIAILFFLMQTITLKKSIIYIHKNLV